MPEATPEFKQQLRVAFDSIEEGQIFHISTHVY